MKALIDGDIVVYRSGFAAEGTVYTLADSSGGEMPSDWTVVGQFPSAKLMKAKIKELGLEEYSVSRERIVEPLSHALSNAKGVIENVKAKLGTDEYVVYLSSGDNFRGKLATMKKYKGNRDKAPKPAYYREIREYLIKNHNGVELTAIEADDAMAIAQNDWVAGASVICSQDKDMLQVPGKHYNWVTGVELTMSPEEGINKLYQQVLTGDSTDNIPGIHRCGPITAEKLLMGVSDERELRNICIDAWQKSLNVPADDAFLSVLQYTPWDGTDPTFLTAEEIVDEILSLVRVGGEYAEAALKENPSEAKRFAES